MKWCKNVDLLPAMEKLVQSWVQDYEEEFEHDVAFLWDQALSGKPEDKVLVWMLRKTGTWLFKEAKVYKKRSFSHMTWCYYEHVPADIKVYRICIENVEDGRVMGRIKELDYLGHVENVKKYSTQEVDYE